MEPEIMTALLQQTKELACPQINITFSKAKEIGYKEAKDKDSTNEIGIESLDYDPIHSTVYARTRKSPQRRHIYGYTGLTFAKWTVTILIGLLVGSVAYLISYSQELLIIYKNTWIKKTMHQGLAVAFIGYATFGIFLVIVASCLVLYWAPAAAGGGVTLVMAYLNGNDIPDLLRFSTLATKILGTICTISSGLPIGQEGPMVHIGAAIASTLTWMHGEFPGRTEKHTSDSRHCCSKLYPKALPFDFHNDKDRREFITAGTAAGLAAAFGSPIGGVLYSLEEASSFWSRKVMWRSLVSTTVATVILSWLHAREFSFALPGSLSFHGIQPVFHIQDLPLLFVTSTGAGILGAFVNISHGWLTHIRPPSSNTLARLMEVCLVTLISIAVIFVMPYFLGHCLQVPDGESDDFWFSYTCPQQGSNTNVYNDLATLFFSVPHRTIQRLLKLGHDSEFFFSVRSLGIHTASFLLLFILAHGIATPGGIFMPSIIVGASFGAFMGSIFKTLFPRANIQPGLHALVGATSMLGGLFRSTVSLVVIMVEGTGGIDFILPIIMAIVVSNWVAHHLHQAGAYEADLERSGNVHFLQSEAPHELISLSATDIMSPNVIGFGEVVPVEDVLKVLKDTRHNGFPIYKWINPEDPGRGRKMVGLILRHQLLLLLEQRAFVRVDPDNLGHSGPLKESYIGTKVMQRLQFLEHAMRVYHHCHNPHRRDLSSMPETVDALRLDDYLSTQSVTEGDVKSKIADLAGEVVSSDHRPFIKKPILTENVMVVNSKSAAAENLPEEISKSEISDLQKKIFALDLHPFMNRAPLTVRSECSAQRVYIIFRTLGLRHLCVTDSNNRVIGMITRKDIAHAQKESKGFERTRPLVHWDSDIQNFYEKDERMDRDKLYNLP